MSDDVKAGSRHTGRVPIDGWLRDPRPGLRAGVRRTLKSASRFPFATIPLAGIRTVSRLTKAAVRGMRVTLDDSPEEVPRSKLTVAVSAQVAIDELVLALMNNPSRIPEWDEIERVKGELTAARELYGERGWLGDPVSFHVDPPSLERPGIRSGRWLGLGYERLTFDSAYEPHVHEPGRERWLDYEPNRTAYAWVLRHQDGPRPWLVCLHGFGTGRAFMDFYAFRAAFLHHVLGINLAIPVHPMHGPRCPGGFSGQEFMSYDLMNVVHGLAQSMWDTRRIISWIRTQEPSALGVYGVSLGGYLTSLLASLEGAFDCAIAGIPISDLPTLYLHHAPPRLRQQVYDEMVGGLGAEVLRVVSPLEMEPLVPRDRRFVYAGSIDLMATPSQAHRLWEHWERPRMAWYHGNHVGYLWSDDVDTFVRDALESSGLAA